ncbi:MAG TPA: hypothetical protein QGH10_15095 [Armatimonadota bacterium]|nr:hypothetical protein [Armatimonadota bacterium]
MPPLRPVGRRGLSFCYALVLLGAMLTLGMVFCYAGLNSANWAYSSYRGQQALYLAEAAVDRAIWMMEDSAAGIDDINTKLTVTETEAGNGVTRTYTSTTYSLVTGSYEFTATAPHNGIAGCVAVRAVGTSNSGVREDLLTVIFPDFYSGGGSTPGGEIADCFNYSVLVNHNVWLNGNLEVRGHPELGGGLYCNGNFWMNGNLDLWGKVSAAGSTTLEGNLYPHTPDAGLYPNSPGVSMPTIDLDMYREMAVADSSYYSGNKTLSGNIVGGTADDPRVIFIEKTLTLDGNLKGVGLLVAKKGIYVDGNVEYSGSDAGWGILTAGSFTLDGNAAIDGLVYCHNSVGDAEFAVDGNSHIFGALVCDVFWFNGNPIFEWDEPHEGLVPILPGSTSENGPPVVDSLFWERI